MQLSQSIHTTRAIPSFKNKGTKNDSLLSISYTISDDENTNHKYTHTYPFTPHGNEQNGKKPLTDSLCKIQPISFQIIQRTSGSWRLTLHSIERYLHFLECIPFRGAKLKEEIE